MNDPWFEVGDLSDIPSPALLIDEARVRSNLARMVGIAGGVDNLRPHIKTHKMPAVLAIKRELGIDKCKAATFEEARIALDAGMADVLLAKQPVGPDIARLAELGSDVSVLVDDAGIARALPSGTKVFVDIDLGMARSGVPPERAPAIIATAQAADLAVRGLHLYDGHIHQSDLTERRAAFDQAMARVDPLLPLIDSPVVVGGGSPTFPLHAERAKNSSAEIRYECSPGTPVFWDWGYGHCFPDLDFQCAVHVLGRVISKPAADTVCLDIGSKAVAPDPPIPRIVVRGLEGAATLVHNEEHLVLKGQGAVPLAVGDPLVGIPIHICPTIHLHSSAWVLEKGKVVRQWQVTARR